METKLLGKQTVVFKHQPSIIGTFTVAGPKEKQSLFAPYFDITLAHDDWKMKSYEKAERKMMECAIFKAIERAGLKEKDIDALLCGDLMNQIISSSFAARRFDTTYIGLFGACSTMAESLAVGACLVDGGYFNNVACATCSHFSTAERQFRFPLELGNQRPPYSQWTVTGSGCAILSTKQIGPRITMATFGKVTDYGVNDVNNMGAAMAPAAMNTLIAHFEDTGSSPDDYDLIITGDLGKLGSEILVDLLENKGYKLGQNHIDCGHAIFTKKQHSQQGGSGCGCSALLLNSYFIKCLNEHNYNKILFMATGALLSPTSSFQGESVPAIAHAIVIESPPKQQKKTKKL